MKYQITCLLLLALGFSSCQPSSTSSTPEEITSQKLSVQEFQALLQEKTNAQLVDVRTPEEVSQGAIDGAITINFHDGDFEQKIAALDKNRPVFLYCKSGGRSGKSAKLLEKLGFQEVYDLKGGYTEWAKSQ